MLKDTGTITFWLRHEHADWATNDSGYKFGVIKKDGIEASAVKNPDRTISVSLAGPFDQRFNFQTAIPPCEERGLFVALTWDNKEVKLYLNGQPIETKQAVSAAQLAANASKFRLGFQKVLDSMNLSRAR
jgi:Concanavalin A-like lectin/glucanases superfamily